MPNDVAAGMTQSPLARPSELEPAARTSKTPSLPGMADGSGVPTRELKGGLEPYVPCIVFMSAGLIGAARARRRTELGGMDGEMECVCRLAGDGSCQHFAHLLLG